jgi:hypothetical protein
MLPEGRAADGSAVAGREIASIDAVSTKQINSDRRAAILRPLMGGSGPVYRWARSEAG